MSLDVTIEKMRVRELGMMSSGVRVGGGNCIGGFGVVYQIYLPYSHFQPKPSLLTQHLEIKAAVLSTATGMIKS